MHKKGKDAESKGTSAQGKEHREKRDQQGKDIRRKQKNRNKDPGRVFGAKMRSVCIKAHRYLGRGLNCGMYTVTKDAEADRSRLHIDLMEVHNDYKRPKRSVPLRR